MVFFRVLILMFTVTTASLPQFGFAGETDAESSFSVVAVLRHERALARPHDVELQDGLAFVPGKGGSLAVVDISKPTEPRLVWHRHDAKRLDEAETVLTTGDRLFLGTHDFHGVNIRDPKHPVFETSISSTSISHINGMARRDKAVIAAGKNGVLAAFDISQPATPTVAAVVNVRERWDIGWPHDVDVYANFAVVPDPQRFGRGNGPGKLALIRVFDTKTGNLLSAQRWRLSGVVATDELVGANRVQVSGKHAFVGASTRADGGQLVVIDLSDPDAPRQVANLAFAPQDGWGPNGLTIGGRVVFLAGGQSVEAIDISRPQQPVKLASQRFADVFQNANPRYSGGGDSGHDLVYRDGYLYVTGQNDNCLMILRVECERLRQLAEPETIRMER